MILDFVYREPECGEPDTRPFLIANIHYMYFATILFWVTAITMIVISLITGGPKKERVCTFELDKKKPQKILSQEDQSQKGQIRKKSVPNHKMIKEIMGIYVWKTKYVIIRFVVLYLISDLASAKLFSGY